MARLLPLSRMKGSEEKGTYRHENAYFPTSYRINVRLLASAGGVEMGERLQHRIEFFDSRQKCSKTSTGQISPSPIYSRISHAGIQVNS